jgi:DHA2 family multidrug resistance protein
VFLPVGIIQGTMAPISGMIGDRIHPKIPIILGIVLLAFSFYLNTSFSFLTEHHYVMTILYIRGFAMGILFAPLSSISLSEISRKNMAQASGLFNIIRQLGGSFGVAILATILTSRVNFHSQLYGQSIEQGSPVYQNVVSNLTYHIEHNTGSSPVTAKRQSQAVVFSQVNKEAFIQGIDDDFMIASFITIFGVIPVLMLHAKKKISSKPIINE